MKALLCRQTPKAWPLIERWVSEALKEGFADHAPDAVRQHLQRGSMQLWLAWDQSRAKGCCITEIAESVRGRVCNLVVCAGHDFASWQPLIADIERWAVAQGCKRMELGGRAGWERVLKPHGWNKIRVTIEKEIEHGFKQAIN